MLSAPFRFPSPSLRLISPRMVKPSPSLERLPASLGFRSARPENARQAWNSFQQDCGTPDQGPGARRQSLGFRPASLGFRILSLENGGIGTGNRSVALQFRTIKVGNGG